MAYIPLLLVTVFFLMVWDAQRTHGKIRLMVCLLPVLLCLQYLAWRLFSTVWLDHGDSGWAQSWIWGVWGLSLIHI
jgi:cellulose synthase (UDP-forming)